MEHQLGVADLQGARWQATATPHLTSRSPVPCKADRRGTPASSSTTTHPITIHHDTPQRYARVWTMSSALTAERPALVGWSLRALSPINIPATCHSALPIPVRPTCPMVRGRRVQAHVGPYGTDLQRPTIACGRIDRATAVLPRASQTCAHRHHRT